MAGFLSISKGKYLNLLLNMSFIFILSCLTITHYSSNSNLLNLFEVPNTIITHSHMLDDDNGCQGIHNYRDNKAKCLYVKLHKGCQSEGYISYLQLFYCNFNPVFGYAILILWLIILFYLLGNTTADYFCSSLEGLSTILKLSPTIAGVTLLSLGNGAPDVFASIVSFMGDSTGEVGLNSILGAALFVSSIVVGIISISTDKHRISVDKSSFIRDVLFLLLCLSCLLVIIILGKINLWGAICFLSLYFIYVFIVSTAHLCSNKKRGGDTSAGSPILPVTKTLLGYEPKESSCELEVPLLGYVGNEKPKPISIDKGNLQFSDGKARTRCSDFFGRFMYILELPLYLPRRLTIPVVSEDRWSKPFGVISVTLAPFLLAVLWNSEGGDMGSKACLVIYIIGGSVGIVSGIIAYVTTERSNPPRKCLFFWLAGGFLMSITWTYIVAQELVSLLVSLGLILRISPSILGLTVLAWGNSLGDLVANVTMALNGGPEGAQVAISGCYAGPIFNTLVGLGLSLVFSSWSQYPSYYVIRTDPFVYETLGFLMGGLLWALVILPKKNMRLDRFLGGGLLAIYLCFLSLRMARALGLVQSSGVPSSFRP